MVRKLNRSNRFAAAIPWAACSLMLCSSAMCGQWEQVHKLTADDAAEDDRFGVSVSVDENIIVVGAYYDAIVGWGTGSAYVFDATTGQQLHKLIADDAAESDRFGFSVSVDGNIIVVGAYSDNDAGFESGSAYVFDATTGQQLHKLTADDGAKGDRFGWSVSVSGNTIVVGAYSAYVEGSCAGAAYIFDAATGQQLYKLIADDADSYSFFGTSVSVCGTDIVIGAPWYDIRTGAVYVFDAVTGQQLRKLMAHDHEQLEEFGCAVSLSGDTIVAGTQLDDDAGVNAGSAYVLSATTGQELYKLLADDGEAGDCFGNSVSVSEETVVIGAQHDDDAGRYSGSAYVFDAASGGQTGKLTANDAAEGDLFGCSVSVRGETMVIGARSDDDAGTNSGSAYVFRKSPPCPADVNGDEVVDIDDLFAVLAAWGPCDDCPEDINDDGIVDIDDVFEVLAQWGPCP